MRSEGALCPLLLILVFCATLVSFPSTLVSIPPSVFASLMVDDAGGSINDSGGGDGVGGGGGGIIRLAQDNLLGISYGVSFLDDTPISLGLDRSLSFTSRASSRGSGIFAVGMSVGLVFVLFLFSVRSSSSKFVASVISSFSVYSESCRRACRDFHFIS